MRLIESASSRIAGIGGKLAHALKLGGRGVPSIEGNALKLVEEVSAGGLDFVTGFLFRDLVTCEPQQVTFVFLLAPSPLSVADGARFLRCRDDCHGSHERECNRQKCE
jgi:hypothetical protein